MKEGISNGIGIHDIGIHEEDDLEDALDHLIDNKYNSFTYGMQTDSVYLEPDIDHHPVDTTVHTPIIDKPSGISTASISTSSSGWLAVDWARSPMTSDEKRLCDAGLDEVGTFLFPMKEVRLRYADNSSRRQLRQCTDAMVLSAWDAFVCGKVGSAVAPPSGDSFPGLEYGITGSTASACAFALNQIGEILSIVEHVSSNDDPIHIALSGHARKQATEAKSRILAHSRVLDVHRWSEHPEANEFVNLIYARHFKGGNEQIRKKYLKVLLLDLFVGWSIDTTLKTSVSRNVNAYNAGSRYNALHISKTTIVIIDKLVAEGLLHEARGFYDRERKGGMQTRIWPTARLTKMFEAAKFDPLEIGLSPEKELIVLRAPHPSNPKKSVDVEYEDGPETNEMRHHLSAYNDLLRRTYIDIPLLEEPLAPLAHLPSELRQSRVSSLATDALRDVSPATTNPRGTGKDRGGTQISQHDKLVRRIFNRGDFSKGGRFYGGWWQRCPSSWRTEIFINDEPTIEIDYSGLHIIMLYARKGIDYWNAVGGYPYDIPLPQLPKDVDPIRVLKRLTLVAINAEDDKEAFHAFRDHAPPEEAHLRDALLAEVLEAVRRKHAPIADLLGKDAGIELMNQDARITERLIASFTADEIPILTIHDSYIVPIQYADRLEVEMQESFAVITGSQTTKLKPSRQLRQPLVPIINPDGDDAAQRLLFGTILATKDQWRSERYVRELNRFRKWLSTSQASD